MQIGALIGLGLSGAFLASANVAASEPRPRGHGAVRIEEVAYGGPGCPSESVAQLLSEDGRAVTLVFDAFRAEASWDAAAHEARASCHIELVISVPADGRIVTATVDTRGWSALGMGMRARASASYSFDEDASPTRSRTRLGGPRARAWHDTDTLTGETDVACGGSPALGALRIDSELTVDGDVLDGSHVALEVMVITLAPDVVVERCP